MNALLPVWALVAWGVTAVLVSQLLGGTFDARSCQTDCVQGLYWSALAVTVAGCVAGGGYLLRGHRKKGLCAKMSVGALLLLLAIFLVTMGVGTFG